jgi:hypothetical protein
VRVLRNGGALQQEPYAAVDEDREKEARKRSAEIDPVAAAMMIQKPSVSSTPC